MLLRRHSITYIISKLYNMIRTMKKKNYGRITGGGKRGNAVSNRVVRTEFVEKVTFEQRLKGSESLLCGYWGAGEYSRVSSRIFSPCKSPMQDYVWCAQGMTQGPERLEWSK